MTRQRKAKLYVIPKPKPDKVIIGQIKNLLDMAKKGEIRGFVCVSHLTEAQVLTTYNLGGCDKFLMLGYAERLKYRLHKGIDDATEFTPHEDEGS